MERAFDEVNEIFSNMSEADYKLTERAAEDYYQYGRTGLVEKASAKLGLSVDEILAWW